MAGVGAQQEVTRRTHYLTLGGTRDRVARWLKTEFGLFEGVLDVGTGEGLFALACAANGASRSIVGIDPHVGCIQNARWLAQKVGLSHMCRFEECALDVVRERYSAITLFLALEDLLRDQSLETLITQLGERLRKDGSLVVSMGLPELAQTKQERLGFLLHRAVGYEYPSFGQIEATFDAAGFELLKARSDTTGAPNIDAGEMRRFLIREAGYQCERGDPKRDIERLWDGLSPAIEAAQNEAQLDARIHTFVAQRYRN